MNELFLAQIRLDRRELLKKRLYTPYAMHQLLWQCFPGRPDAARDFLFRWDEGGVGGTLLLLAQTAPQVADWGQWEGVKRFSPQFTTGGLFWFKLRANPVRREAASGKLRAVTGQDALYGWLQHKGGQHGFVLKSEPETSAGLARFSRTAGGPQFQLNVAEFSGVLEVADPQLFTEAFIRGIGRGKAFGCGMLLLKKITQ